MAPPVDAPSLTSASGMHADDAIDVDSPPPASKKLKNGSGIQTLAVKLHMEENPTHVAIKLDKANAYNTAPTPPTLAAEPRGAFDASPSVAPTTAGAPRAVSGAPSVLDLILRAGEGMSADAFRAALENDTRSIVNKFRALADAIGPLAASARARENAATSTSEDKGKGRANRAFLKLSFL